MGNRAIQRDGWEKGVQGEGIGCEEGQKKAPTEDEKNVLGRPAARLGSLPGCLVDLAGILQRFSPISIHASAEKR